MAAFRSVSVTRSYEQVVDQVLARIRAGDFLPGSRLPTERELGDIFGVSRGVIREALKVLITLGAVESRQGSGTYVAADLTPMVSRALVLSARPEPGSLSDLMEMRAPLERFAVRLAAERRTAAQSRAISEAAEASNTAAAAGDWDTFGRADVRFHNATYAASANPLLITVMGAIREIQQNAVAMVSAVTGSMSLAAEQHVEIAAAIWDGDADRAERIMIDHIAYATGAVMTTLAGQVPHRSRAADRDIGDNARTPEPVGPAGR